MVKRESFVEERNRNCKKCGLGWRDEIPRQVSNGCYDGYAP